MSTENYIKMLRDNFSYNAVTGVLTRLTGKALGPVASHTDQVSLDGVQIRVTHVMWALAYNRLPATDLIDHRDGNRQNRKLDNLREATPLQNQYNKESFGQFDKGVVHKHDANRKKPWSARIRINGEKIILGSFATQAEAAAAYQAKAEEIQGEFAVHNSRRP